MPTSLLEKGTLEAFTNVYHYIDRQLDDYRLEEWVTTKMTGGAPSELVRLLGLIQDICIGMFPPIVLS